MAPTATSDKEPAPMGRRGPVVAHVCLCHPAGRLCRRCAEPPAAVNCTPRRVPTCRGLRKKARVAVADAGRIGLWPTIPVRFVGDDRRYGGRHGGNCPLDAVARAEMSQFSLLHAASTRFEFPVAFLASRRGRGTRSLGDLIDSQLTAVKGSFDMPSRVAAESFLQHRFA
jgi:hypothetical protein